MAAIDVSIAPSFDGKIVTVAEPGTLSKLLAGYDQTTITELTVIGSLNNYDIETLKAFPNLAVLDIENVNLEKILASSGLFSGWQKSLVSIILPKTLKEIGDYAFEDCSGLTGDLTIPESVTTIGNYAFYDCFRFTGDLTIPESVTTIGDNAFEGCSGFTGNLTIPESVTTIGNYAFEGCSGFTGSLTIPEGVTTIGNHVFSGCSGFTGNLTIPESVTTIGTYAFLGCSVTNVYCKATTPPQIESATFYLPSKMTLYVPTGCADAYRTAPEWSKMNFKEIIETNF